MDFLAEMHYASCDPAYNCNEDEADYAEFSQYVSKFEIECDDREDTIAEIRKGEDMLARLRDDDYDLIEHLEGELEKARSYLHQTENKDY
jgi:hypothetical protein